MVEVDQELELVAKKKHASLELTEEGYTVDTEKVLTATEVNE